MVGEIIFKVIVGGVCLVVLGFALRKLYRLIWKNEW